MSILKRLAKTAVLVAYDNLEDILSVTLVPYAIKQLSSRIGIASSKWLFTKIISNKAIDGAILRGLNLYNNSGAKFALRHGLPKTAGQRRLAVENEPHTLDGFNGVIKSGYGKGTKKLLYKGQAIVKVKGQSTVTDIEYHEHLADRAGLHYDLAVKGLPEDSELFELNIGRGPAKGRYSFARTDRGYVVGLMKDRGIVLDKPKYKLVDEEFISQISEKAFTIERKYDGSLGIVNVYENRAIVHSHRPTSSTYYDKLPSMEFLQNKSPFLSSRRLFPGPDIDGTVLKVELVHPNGNSVTSGILNSSADNAVRVQQKIGNVVPFVWDIAKYKGKDVSKLPYSERRALFESVVERIGLFNKNWQIAEKCPSNMNPLDFYQAIINDRRGLPYAEGIVVKDNTKVDEHAWLKVKLHDLVDMKIISFQEGENRLVGSLGGLVAQDLVSGKIAVVGTGLSDFQRDWIWDHRALLNDAVIKVKVFEETNESFRAPRFVEFHETKGNNEFGLMLYADVLSGMNGEKAMLETKYKLISG